MIQLLEIKTNKKQNHIFTPLLYICSFASALFLNNPWIIFLVTLVIIMLDRKYIITALILMPLVESIMLVSEGFTASKLLVVSLIFLFTINAFKNKIILDNKIKILLIILGIALIGAVNAIFFSGNLLIQSLPFYVLKELLAIYIPTILFTILLYQYINDKGILYLLSSLKLAKWIISVALIIVSIYFLTIGHTTTSWYNVAERMIFTGSDPNAFSGMMVSLAVFTQILIYKSKNLFEFIVGLLSTFFVAYSVLLTLSRGGFLTLIIMLSVSFFIFSNRNKLKGLGIVTIMGLILALFIVFGIIDFQPLKERFWGDHITDVSSLTASRTVFWRVALNRFWERPFLGFGGSQLTPKWLLYQAKGFYAVFHNTYLELCVRYGIVGGISYFGIILYIFSDFKLLKSLINRKKILNDQSEILIVPYISLFTLLFSAMNLSWLWKEIIWFFIGITFSIGALIRKQLLNEQKSP